VSGVQLAGAVEAGGTTTAAGAVGTGAVTAGCEAASLGALAAAAEAVTAVEAGAIVEAVGAAEALVVRPAVVPLPGEDGGLPAFTAAMTMMSKAAEERAPVSTLCRAGQDWPRCGGWTGPAYMLR